MKRFRRPTWLQPTMVEDDRAIPIECSPKTYPFSNPLATTGINVSNKNEMGRNNMHTGAELVEIYHCEHPIFTKWLGRSETSLWGQRMAEIGR